MFFWFFHSLSLFLYPTNGIDECEKFHVTQFNQNTPDLDNFWSVKCSKMTFLVMFQKICAIMKKINQTLPYVVKQGASVCTEDIQHNTTTKFRARGFFWVFFALSFYFFLSNSNFSGVMNHIFYKMPVFKQSSLAQNYHKRVISCQKKALKQVVNVTYTTKNWCLIIQ